MSYATVDDVIECICQLGPGAELMKVDLKNAYRMGPIHPQDHHLLGITWQEGTYVDRALPYGLRSAPNIFSAVANMLAWAVYCSGVQHQIHYLDDFLFMVPPNTREGTRVLSLGTRVLNQGRSTHSGRSGHGLTGFAASNNDIHA